MSDIDTSGRGRRFGAVAEDYDRFRLTYRPEIYAAIAAYTGGPPARVLEVGAGTGKATVALAERGYAVTAVEPDDAMRAVLQRRTAGLADVEVVGATFEDYQPVEPADLLVSALAWHWTDEGSRWERAAAALRPGGTVALMGNRVHTAGPTLTARVHEIADPYTSAVPRRPGSEEPVDGLHWPATEVLRQAAFADLAIHEVTVSEQVPASFFVGHLATTSAYLLLPPDRRTEVLDRLARELPDPLPVLLLSWLVLARRR